MSLSRISSSSKNEELAIQRLIFDSIDNFDNFVFNAGAGSGKTYALTECLKYIINKHGDLLFSHKQKIMCITYTNVATNEIKSRLGNTDLVKVSTIHERLWTLIKDYKKELLKIHVEKLDEELNRLQFELNDNYDEKESKHYKVFRDLSDDLKIKFYNVMMDNKEMFYKYYDKTAKEFRCVFDKNISQFNNLLNNVSNFKKIASTIYKIENYRYCLMQIRQKNPKYSKVRYEDKFNSDILHRMVISHDTLLEYALRMVKTYDLFKRVVFDCYPYILIDEYQDTNKNVVKIMKLLDDHAKSIQRNLLIGYFGDTAQNIYEEGVGSDLINIHPGLKLINKKYNRRSHAEIIDVINKIRNDVISQTSIYDDCSGGSVKFYTGAYDIKNHFIDKYKKQWNINKDNKLHCLVLLNRMVAECNGFPDIYKHFSETDFYKKNYDRLNTELLSNDVTKLGNIPSLFYIVLRLIINISDNQSTINSFIDKSICSKMSFFDLRELVAKFKSIKCHSLGEFFKDLFAKYEKYTDCLYRQVIEHLINLDRYSYLDFINYLLDGLYLNFGNWRIDEFKLKLKEILSEELMASSNLNKADAFKSKFAEIIDVEAFSYIDKEEVNNFKEKLHQYLDDEKLSDMVNINTNAIILKLDKLFEDELLSFIDIDEVEIAKAKLQEILSIDLNQWILWYEFINGEQNSDVIYHTYHGTKGAEYDNVIIIMENDFGRMDKDKFSSFFKNYKTAATLNKAESIKFDNTKNLLYVSCSRAIKNLRILYLDNVTEFKDGIESIFDNVLQYSYC